MENRLSKEMMENPFAKEPKASSTWYWQIITGIALVFLLGLHFIANHFIAQGGIRDYADVVSYLRNPIILVWEVFFLVVVAAHAMLGIRAIIMDFGIPARAEKRLSQILTVIGVITVGYGLWLTWAIIH
jgi:succinate dehydrogenase / fumarate reductase, membrane anchor subunit